MNDTHIYLARFDVEADGPLAIGSGQRGVLVDQLVARDAYGFPYLPGTSLAGVVRSELGGQLSPEVLQTLFGFQGKEKEGQGSRVMFTSGHLIGPNGVIGEGTVPDEDDFLQHFLPTYLPERDHVRINHRGVADAEGRGKFDRQLVPRGSRFRFEVWLEGTEADQGAWKQLLQVFHHPLFRIGSGTRKGFGKLAIKHCRTRTYNLREAADRTAYLAVTGNLNDPVPGLSIASIETPELSGSWEKIHVELTPRDFFFFGSGIGNENVDKTSKTEWFVDWNDDQPTLRMDPKERDYLIPATSIKGAISHRVAYYYNCLTEQTIEKQCVELPELNVEAVAEEVLSTKLSNISPSASSQELQKKIEELQALLAEVDTLDPAEHSTKYADFKSELEQLQKQETYPNTGELNPAVRRLFGYAVERNDQEDKPSAQRGRVLLEDIHLTRENATEKTFSHVMIDRFTGGAKQGALFQESTVETKQVLKFKLYVHTDAFKDAKELDQSVEGKHVREALKRTLDDLRSGALPLGGNVAKGHGIFTGTHTFQNDAQ